MTTGARRCLALSGRSSSAMVNVFRTMQPLLGCIALLSFGLIPPAAAQTANACLPQEDGGNPCPAKLRRPEQQPLSAMAEIGKAIFYDKALSGSGKLSCASCHEPANHYAPSGFSSVFLGGPHLDVQGRRAVPTLTYLERRPNFSIGPDNPVSEAAPAIPANALNVSHGAKSASNTGASATNIVPQGGYSGMAVPIHCNNRLPARFTIPLKWHQRLQKPSNASTALHIRRL